jgi:hypothetical protein
MVANLNTILQFKFQECRVLRREKEIALEELQRAQDTISRLKIEKSSKSIDLYDPNNPDVLHKRIKQHEKQMQELEDENEKHINELSKIEKSLAEYKAENNQLRSMANEARIYKENEEGMILELAGLKNELEKCIQFNQQLTEENQRLVEENNHKKTVSEGNGGNNFDIRAVQLLLKSIAITNISTDYYNPLIRCFFNEAKLRNLLHNIVINILLTTL